MKRHGKSAMMQVTNVRLSRALRAMITLITGIMLLSALPGATAEGRPGAALAPAAAAPGGSLFSTADYDSGWIEMAASSSELLEHNLGGNPDNYVVDVHFWDRESSAGDLGVHNWGYGTDYGGVGDVEGVNWQNLTDSSVRLVRATSDVEAAAVRVRIWVMPRSDYDSGWQALDPGEDRTLAHNLGGDTDDYVVDMQFRSSNPVQGVNQLHYGGDRLTATIEYGAYWHSLSASSITAHRGSDDVSEAAEVRVRIWRKPDPDWDSGWKAFSYFFDSEQDMGGPWNDFVVDLQFKDTDGAYGVNQRGYGGDRLVGSDTYGAYWSDLTSCGVRVDRGGEDTAADEARVRIWGNRSPKYDSGWYPLAQDGWNTFVHDLGGTPDGYMLDLQFKDTAADGISGAGVNQRNYGGDLWYDYANARHVQHGVWWHHLTDESIFVYRFGDDYGADEVRVRLWMATGADYDSGWQTIIMDTLILSHNVGGDPDNYVVDLQFRDSVGTNPQGVNQGRYGGDTYFEDGVTHKALGAFWHSLTDSSITVSRLDDAAKVDEVRVRIWNNNSFDYVSGWQSISNVHTFNHNLATCPDGLVVDLQFESDDTYGVHQRTYGGDSIYGFGELHQYGAHWQALTSHSVEVYRQPDDGYVDRARVRIWNTPGCRVHLPLVVRN